MSEQAVPVFLEQLLAVQPISLAADKVGPHWAALGELNATIDRNPLAR